MGSFLRALGIVGSPKSLGLASKWDFNLKKLTGKMQSVKPRYQD